MKPNGNVLRGTTHSVCNSRPCTCMHTYIHYNTVHCIAVQYCTVRHHEVRYITLHYIALHYCRLHCIALQNIALQYNTLHTYMKTHIVAASQPVVLFQRLAVFQADSNQERPRGGYISVDNRPGEEDTPHVMVSYGIFRH